MDLSMRTISYLVHVLCPWLWKIWQLPNTKIHCVMPLFVEVVINLGFKGLNKRLCLLATDITEYFGCDCMTCYFTCAKGSTFKNVVVGGLKWLDIDEPCTQLCTMSSSQCGWLNWPTFSRGFCWPMMYVVWTIFRNHHYVDLWLMFLRLAHGMSHATSGRSANWQMVLPLVHQVNHGF